MLSTLPGDVMETVVIVGDFMQATGIRPEISIEDDMPDFRGLSRPRKRVRD
ncbi:MAG: hypothetical protein ACXWKP_15955 [Bradyrhizobium sp.]